MELMKMQDGVKITSNMIAELTGKRHDHVLRDVTTIVEEIGYPTLGSDISETTYLSRGKGYKNYTLSKDGLMLIITGYSAVHRMKLIKYCGDLERQIASHTKQLSLSELLQQSTLMLEELSTKNIVLENKIEEDKPKVEYHDKVLEVEGLLTVTKIAKDLGMSAVKLNGILHEEKVIYKQSNCWYPYAKYQYLIDEGYCDYYIGEFSQMLKWTEKGRKFIYELLRSLDHIE